MNIKDPTRAVVLKDLEKKAKSISQIKENLITDLITLQVFL